MPDSGKKLLSGFSHLYYLEVTDTAAGYSAKTGATAVRVEGAQSCSNTVNKDTLKVAADDNSGYYSEGTFTDGELTITVAGMKLADLSKLASATYDSSTITMDETEVDAAPEVSLSFSGLLAGAEGYRLFRYYNCRLTSFAAGNLNTRGESTEVASIELTFSFGGRAYDGLFRTTHDIEKPSDASAVSAMTTWLTTVATVPSV